MTRVPRGLIGVIHLSPMPGDPRYRGGGFDAVEGLALADADALVSGGVGALIVENFGSAPFAKGDAQARLEAHQVAAMALIVRSVASRYRVAVGVNCLRNDAIAALAIAGAAGVQFIRVNVHTGVYVTDQGIIEGEAHRSMRYRRTIGADHVAVLADVHVKHASPLGTQSIERAAEENVERGLADANIVSGEATGAPPSAALVARLSAATRHPLILGSGLSVESAPDLLPHVDAAIVGTWVKGDGDVSAPVDVARVRKLVAVASGRFRKPRA